MPPVTAEGSRSKGLTSKKPQTNLCRLPACYLCTCVHVLVIAMAYSLVFNPSVW